MTREFDLLTASRKGTFSWLARGLSSHATRLYVGSFGAARSVVVCGYPRSGTSWVSDVLSRYYGLPCHRHYIAPKLHPQVMHTHDLQLGDVRRVFYMVRRPRDVYVSLFVKRYGIGDVGEHPDGDALRARFTEFVQSEMEHPHESPCRWSDHVAQGYRRFGKEAVLAYASSADFMGPALARRIAILEGSCDTDRLEAFVRERPVGKEAVTTLTPDASRRFQWFDARAADLVEAETRRLWDICPDARSLPLFD